MEYTLLYSLYASISALILWIAITIVFFIANKKDKWAIVDIFWASGFVVVALLGWGFTGFKFSWYMLPVLFITLWGFRLGFHLTKRMLTIKEDPRYDAIKEKSTSEFVVYIKIFVLQALFIWIMCLPLYFYMVLPEDILENNYIFTALGAIICIWGLGWEWTADYQLKRFKKPQQIVRDGLWKYTRHPNYFGEISFWTGIYIMTRFILPSDMLLTAILWTISLLSPLLIYIIIAKITGPLLEQEMEKYPEWSEYKKITPYIVPKLP